MTEQELCNIVKKSDLFPGFRLHEEVGISSVSCDMVYENGNEVYTIEAKTELNFKVIAQAIRWQRVVTASFIAVPMSSTKGWWDNPKRNVVEALGIGIIWVGEDKATFAWGCNPFVNPLRDRCDLYKFPADIDFWKVCFDRIKDVDGIAGSKLCKRSTTFSRTIEALKIEAEKHPEFNLKQLLAIVPTHYSSVSSAEGAIRRYAKHGIIQQFWKE